MMGEIIVWCQGAPFKMQAPVQQEFSSPAAHEAHPQRQPAGFVQVKENYFIHVQFGLKIGEKKIIGDNFNS